MYLQGGLGNQLFQLAAGLAISKRLNVDLILDCSRLGNPNNALRRYALEPFPLPTSVRVIRHSNWLQKLLNKRFVNRITNPFSQKHLVEVPGGFDARISQVQPGWTLDGYFQSSLYFQNYKSEIVDLLQSCRIDADETRRINDLAKMPFTAVHVRRGDYTDPAVAAVHGLAGEGYFAAALDCLNSKAPLGRVLYFTDSPSIVVNELGISLKDVVPNDLSETATLVLMSRAKNVIASNSSFSWWAGLMAESRANASVVVPKPWFVNSTPKDLIPSSWVSINKS
jgi:hypothetical protein